MRKILFTSITILTALFLFSQNVVYAFTNPSFSCTLKNPIEFYSEQTSLSDEKKTELSRELTKLSQRAFESYTNDYPIESAWIDFSSTTMSYNISGTKQGDGYLFEVNAINATVGVDKKFIDPSGMIKMLKDKVAAFKPSGSTMYEVVKSIHDYIRDITVYDTKGDFAYNAFGSLIDGKAVCEGYSEAFKALCDYNGIPCVLVCGKGVKKSSTENHKWACVKMDDGKWYGVDVTWDDTAKTDKYFLVGSKTKINDVAFGSSHVAVGDMTGLGLFEHTYPTLSEEKYVESGKAFKPSTACNNWYNDQLDDNQKAFYDCLSDVELPKGSKAYQTTEGTTTVIDTTKDDNTSVTTKEKETTKEKTTTKSEETTKEKTTTKDKGTTKPQTTEISTTVVEETTTVEITSEITTEVTTELKTESSTEQTEILTEITEIITLPDSDTTVTDSKTETATSSQTEKTEQQNEKKNNVVIIVIALAVIFSAVIFIVIKASKKA